MFNYRVNLIHSIWFQITAHMFYYTVGCIFRVLNLDTFTFVWIYNL